MMQIMQQYSPLSKNKRLIRFIAISSIVILPSLAICDSLEQATTSLTKNAASRAASGSTDVKDIAVDAANIASRSAIKAAKQRAEDGDLPEWLTRTDIEISFKKDDDPSIAIETIQPIKQDELSTTFWQGRIASRDGDQTLNLGLGYRRLVKDKQWMLGPTPLLITPLKTNINMSV